MLSQPHLRFRNLGSGKYAESIWADLFEGGIWRNASFDVHESNTLAGAGDRSSWNSVIPGWMPLHDGQIWCDEQNKALDPIYVPKHGTGTMTEFLLAAHSFFERFKGRKIGVQLSGGLDSTLIIGLLRYFDIDHGLVGLHSDRYEFRTERHVQELLARNTDCLELIDERQCLPCARLDEVTPHQIPDVLSLNFAQDTMMAEACNKLGIEILLSGGGGDNLLGLEVPQDAQQCGWRPQTFTDPFPRDVVYLAHGIEFISFFSDLAVVDAVYSLRRGQQADYQKRWARQFFREFLPRELVEFAYCADFWGRYVDGLVEALPTVRALHRKARDYTQNRYFDEGNLEELLSKDLLRPQKQLYQQIEARASSAAWVCSLVENLTFANIG